jgi:hypothetical protein
MSTTNGTRALDRVRDVPLLMTAALPNREAVAQRLHQHKPDTLAIVGSGWEGSYSLEDSLAAGALVHRCWNWIRPQMPRQMMKPQRLWRCGSSGCTIPRLASERRPMGNASFVSGITTQIFSVAPALIS